MPIEIRVKDGKVEATVNGVVGKGCLEIIEKIKNIPGAQIQDQRLTDEYHQEENFLTNENG